MMVERTSNAMRLDRLEKDVSELRQVIILGSNNKPSLITQMAVLNNQIDNLVREVNELKSLVVQGSKYRNGNNHMTYQWFAEKVLLPILLPLIGMAIGAGVVTKMLGG